MNAQTKKWLHIVSFSLVIVGGLNWGLYGLLDLDLVDTLFGGLPFLANLVYVLFGAAALYLVFTHKDECKVCNK